MSHRKIHIQIASKHKLVKQGTTQLRCFQPAAYLESRGFKTTLSQFYRSIPQPCDILILHRVRKDHFTEKYIQYAHALGAIVAYDADDLIFTDDIHEYMNTINRNGYVSGSAPNPYRQAMALCDVVLVSVPFLAEQAQKFHANVRVIRNALSREYLNSANKVYEQKQKNPASQEITLAYLSGSSSHDNDFKLIEPALIDVLSRHNGIKLLVVGPLRHSGKLFAFKNRFVHKQRVTYSEFSSLFEQIDINLIPLEVDQSFCQGKSELKYFEAGVCGVPSVASPTEVFKEVIKDKENGILANNDNDWINALEYMIRNPEKRKVMGDTARGHVLQNYAPEARAKDWEVLLQDILNEHKRKKIGANNFKQYFLRLSLEYMRWRRELRLKGQALRKRLK